MRVLGILFVVLGVILLIYGGLTLFIPREVIDLNVMSITVRQDLVIPLPPIIGLLLLVAGIVMVASGPAAAAPPPPPSQPPPY